jgi:Kef-type K+ transport system membrane component KefB
MHLEAEIINQVIISIGISAVIAYVIYKLKQPVILGYIIAGVIIGPQLGLKLVTNPAAIDFSSELGLIALMFIVGLEMDFGKIKRSGSVIVITAVAQFVICFALGIAFFFIPGLVNNGALAVIYLAFTFALSSTMIVVKLLYDKFELDTLPGRITLGILIIQDVWAIIFLAIQPNLANMQLSTLAISFLKGLGLVFGAWLISKFLLPTLFKSIARNTELLVVSALGWCFLICWATADLAGLSRAMGALIAGITLSRLPYAKEITDRVGSIRSFFLILFFVSLGLKVTQPSLHTFLVALAGSAFLILSRFIALTPVLLAMKKGLRVSFLVPLNIAQISEFSLVIVALGVGFGHVDATIMTIILFTLMITLTASTYMITYSHNLYLMVQKLLNVLHIKLSIAEEKEADVEQHTEPIMFLGSYKIANSLFDTIVKRNSPLKEKVMVMDFNPETYKKLNKNGIHCVYGDLGNTATLVEHGLEKTSVVVSTIPDTILKGTSNMALLKFTKRINPRARVVVTAENTASAKQLWQAGADFVIIPHAEVSEKLVVLLEPLLNEANIPQVCIDCRNNTLNADTKIGD